MYRREQVCSMERKHEVIITFGINNKVRWEEIQLPWEIKSHNTGNGL